MARVIKYVTKSGLCPLDEFIADLIKNGCKDDVQKIISYIRLLEIHGNKILKNSNWAKKLIYTSMN